MRTFHFDITQRVTVQIDEMKFSEKMMAEFNATICDFGTGEEALLEHGEYIARLAASGAADFFPKDFVEGYGPVAEAGISVSIDLDYTNAELMFPEKAGAA